MGAGVYLARKDKAMRFAQDNRRHCGSAGGLVECVARIRNPKYVRHNNTSSRSEGYDACRADETTKSDNMSGSSPIAAKSVSSGSAKSVSWAGLRRSRGLPARPATGRFPTRTRCGGMRRAICPKRLRARFVGTSASAICKVRSLTLRAAPAPPALGAMSPAQFKIYAYAQQYSGMLMLGDKAPMIHLDALGNVVVPEKPYPDVPQALQATVFTKF